MVYNRPTVFILVLLAALAGGVILPIRASDTSTPQRDFRQLLQTAGQLTVPDPATVVELVHTVTLASQPRPLAETGDLPTVPITAPAFDIGAGSNCYQWLANSWLDVIELGDGTGTAEPWVSLIPQIYYSSDDYVSPAYSLALIMGDGGDATPMYDMFGQGFIMPADLTSVTVTYMTAVDSPRAADEVYGEFWSVKPDGTLGEPLLFWPVGDDTQPNTWLPEHVDITEPDFLSLLEDRWLALVFYNYNENSSPTTGEIVWFDDITMTVCTGPSTAQLFLPNISEPGEAMPHCSPPTENPPDQWNESRGSVETTALCESDMSNFDRQDYYSYVPAQSGDHTFHLQDLPAGSEWSLSVFLDQTEYPPPIIDGGNCRTTAPGSGNKQVTCQLQGNTGYFMKISAGSDYNGPVASYRVQITRP